MHKKFFVFFTIWTIFANHSCADECWKMKQNIISALQKTSYCTHDSDCKAASDLHCPFTYSLVNKNADLSKIKKMISKYENICGKCIYDIVIPNKDEIKCNNKRCVNIRI